MVNKIVSEDYADIMVQNRYISITDGAIPLTSRISMLNVPVSEINNCSFNEYGYQSFPFCYSTESILSLNASRIPNVQKLPNLGLLGQGVMVAIIDTGIDYQHEAFINADNTSRIYSIWDQTINEDESITTVNSTVLYGKEYTREDINAALASENPLEIVPTKDENGHGTAIAGIVAGNENIESNFRGVVPQAELIVVKLKQAKNITKRMFAISESIECFQETDIIFAVNYVKDKAVLINRPIVICLALGTNQGSHDGRGVLSYYLSEISDISGVCVVISAGNEGVGRRHFYDMLTSNVPFNELQVRVGKDEPGFAMELWKNSPSRIAVDITSPTGEYIKPIYPSLNNCTEYKFIFVPTMVWVNNFLIESNSGDQLVLIRLYTPSEGLWKIRVYNLDNQTTDYHVWLPARGIITDDTYFINSNPDTTITSPGNSYYPLTITAYNQENNSIYYAASRGLTRNAVLKPELAAPGVNLVCPIANNKYGTITGTGAAAAHAAGIAAMLLEWGIIKGNHATMDGFDVKSMLIRGSNKNPDDSINNIWGYGRIDAYGVFEAFTY